MAEPSDLTPNQEEIIEENVQPEEENRQEEPTERMPAEAPEGPTVPEERTNKGLGKRQDQLNEKVDLSNQIFIEEQAEKENKKRKERMEMKFPPFPAHLDTLDLDPPNVYSSKQKRKKK